MEDMKIVKVRLNPKETFIEFLSEGFINAYSKFSVNESDCNNVKFKPTSDEKFYFEICEFETTSEGLFYVKAKQVDYKDSKKYFHIKGDFDVRNLLGVKVSLITDVSECSKFSTMKWSH